jgi:hypothetical protein
MRVIDQVVLAASEKHLGLADLEPNFLNESTHVNVSIAHHPLRQK